MSAGTIGIIGLGGLFALLAVRMPVAIVLILVGLFGIAALNGWPAAYATLASETFVIASFYELSVIPLFVLMGNFATASGMSRDLYAAAYAWIGHWRGGLASATIVGCSGFAALSGSSVASAVTMGRVALPEMQRYRYDPRLATGAVAAGGTLGILIPPSTGFVIYAVLTEQSIGRLFLAGVLPGILLTGLFVATIYLLTRIRPALGPAGPVTALRARLTALVKAGPMVGIVLLTIGGIYGGVFTAVEAAGVGAFVAMLVAVARRALSWPVLSTVLLQSTQTTAMSFLILIGAHIFSPFLALSHIPTTLGEALLGLEVGRYGALLIILAAYIVLGTFLEGFAILVLTMPIVFPLVVGLGFDPIWFGVVLVIVLEMGLISPPVGVNVFVVKGIAEGVPMKDIFAGIVPFWLAMIVCLALLVAFPEIALVLPNTMFD
ncbi:MAG: TRAP transporter large permease [Alphaproteobacteria bacterium]